MEKSEKVIGNFIWRLLERFGAQGVTLVVSIVLARLLDPEVYGTIALVTVFTSLLSVFVDSGLGSALIQKKDADDLDFSSVFFFNLGMCTLLYLGLFFAAPLIANFYGLPELVPVIRVMGLTLIISGVKNIQQAYVSRNMLFKKFFFATLGGTIGAAVIGITMAYFGFGVWALVGQYLFNTLTDTIVLWITVKWRPKWMFSFRRLKSLFGFGTKLLGISLTTTIYEDARQLLIGKFYTKSDLAFYNKGKQFPALFDYNINASIDSILLPVMSKSQDDLGAVKAIMRRSIKTSTYIMAPILVGLAMCGDAFIELLLTDKWLPCVPYMRIFCFTKIFAPMITANQNAYKSIGRVDLYLKGSMITKVFGIAVLILSLPHGVMAITYGLLLCTVIDLFIYAFANRRILDYGLFKQMKDVMPALLLSALMGGAVYLVELWGMNALLTLFVQVLLGAAIYLFGSVIFRFESFHYILNIVKKKRKKPAEEKVV